MRMLDFQLQTLRWMRDQERAPRGLNGSFWEERRWADAAPPADDDEKDEASRFSLKKKGKKEKRSATSAEGRFWYFPLAGELRLAEPPVRRGGMLCEEMGLGKTVEVLGLVCADKEAAASEAAARGRSAEASRSAVDCTRGDSGRRYNKKRRLRCDKKRRRARHSWSCRLRCSGSGRRRRESASLRKRSR